MGNLTLDFFGFGNGSLPAQLSASVLNNYNPYPLHDEDSQVWLSMYPDSSASLAFWTGDGNFALTLPVLSMLLNSNASRALVVCSYPLSGQYNHLPRILFYVALVVAIIFREYTVVATAALGSAMTYSTVAAIHLFVLLGTYKFGFATGENDYLWPLGWDSRTAIDGGDMDILGIMPVISASAVTLTPILAWSNTFRTSKARALVVYWALIIFASMIPLYKILIEFGSKWNPDFIPSFAYCTSKTPYCQDRIEISTYQDYHDCGCVDFCGLLSPQAPLRRYANMVPVLHYKAVAQLVCYNGDCSKGEDSTRELYIRLVDLVLVMWALVIIQGLATIFHSHVTLDTVRAYVFRIFYTPIRTIILLVFRGNRQHAIMSKLHLDYTARNPGFLRRCHRFVAKTIAGAYYSLTVLGMFAYPLLFLLTIGICEIIVGQSATSEHSDSIGAWSSWAAAALIILASIIVTYHGTWVSRAGGVLRAPLNWIRYDKDDRPTRERLPKKEGPRLLVTVRDMGIHPWYKWKQLMWTAGNEFRYFQAWWRDPERFSEIDAARFVAFPCSSSLTSMLPLDVPSLTRLVHTAAS